MKLYLTQNGTKLMMKVGLERLPESGLREVPYRISVDKYHEIRVSCNGVITLNGWIAGYYEDTWIGSKASEHAQGHGLDIIATVEYIKHTKP